MNNSKIKAVMSEVAAEAAERDEMIQLYCDCIVGK